MLTEIQTKQLRVLNVTSQNSVFLPRSQVHKVQTFKPIRSCTRGPVFLHFLNALLESSSSSSSTSVTSQLVGADPNPTRTYFLSVSKVAPTSLASCKHPGGRSYQLLLKMLTVQIQTKQQLRLSNIVHRIPFTEVTLACHLGVHKPSTPLDSAELLLLNSLNLLALFFGSYNWPQ